MSNQMNESTLTAEVERRLDNLFEEVAEEESLEQAQELEMAEESKEDQAEENINTTVPDHLDSLKSIVLSLEWEMSDEVMAKFLSETEELKKTYEQDKILFPFVQILHSLGKYIKTYKAKAHPEAVKLLNSTFQNFSKVVSSDDMEEAEKKNLLMPQVVKFRKLKDEVSKVMVGARGIQKHVKLDPGEIEKIVEEVVTKTREMLQDLFNDFFQQMKSEMEFLKEQATKLELEG